MKKKIVALCVASLVGLAACGGDGDSTDTTAPADETTTTVAETPGTIVEVAAGTADFSTLVAAVEAAELVDALSGTGPFTVFAPTNAAFDALPEGLLDKLLLPENKEVLTKILTYHVVEGKLMAADVAAGDAATLEGSNITIAVDGGVTINDATVTATDVEASNGVIHVIDKVIVPPTVDLASL